jgi:hypothetical protein
MDNDGGLQEIRPMPDPERECTNPICLAVGGAVLVALIYPLVLAITHSSIRAVGSPLDPDDRYCGLSPGVEDYPLAYFPTPYPQYTYRVTCVKSCPKDTSSPLHCAPNKLVPSCASNPSFNNLSSQVLVYPSTPYKEYACLPLLPVYFQRIKQSIQPSFLQALVIDIRGIWLYMMGAFLTVVALTLPVIKLT